MSLKSSDPGRANLLSGTSHSTTQPVKSLPLRRDASKCHCPRRAHVSTQQEGRDVHWGSDLGGDDLSGSRLRWFTPFLFDRVSFSLFAVLLLLVSNFPRCHYVSLLPWLLSSSNVVGMQDRWQMRGPVYRLAAHQFPSLSPLKSLSLSCLQLTIERGKSSWICVRSNPVPSCSICLAFFSFFS